MERTHAEKEVDAVLAVTKPAIVHIDESHNTLSVTTKIRNNGARIWINALGEVDKKAAAGDGEGYGELIKSGANIIQTDYPALLMQYLKRRNLYY